MDQPDATRKRRNGLSVKLAAAACAGAAALVFALPSTSAFADPTPVPGPTDPTPAPLDPNATPVDPNATPVDPNAAPVDPNAVPVDPNAEPAPEVVVEPGRVTDEAGGLTYVIPEGWVRSDSSQLTYGSSLLTKPEVSDTSILIGKLDTRLFAGAEPDNQKAAARLASDMGEFFMPYPGTRFNQETIPLDAAGVPGSASYYEVKFSDTTKPNGQIWAAAIGNPLAPGAANQGATQERWFVVWLGTATSPVDKAAAKILAESIRAWYPPPPPVVDPNAPVAEVPPAEGDVPGQSVVGVPVPVTEPVPGMMPAG